MTSLNCSATVSRTVSSTPWSNSAISYCKNRNNPTIMLAWCSIARSQAGFSLYFLCWKPHRTTSSPMARISQSIILLNWYFNVEMCPACHHQSYYRPTLYNCPKTSSNGSISSRSIWNNISGHTTRKRCFWTIVRCWWPLSYNLH